jgi:hypothetical protein
VNARDERFVDMRVKLSGLYLSSLVAMMLCGSTNALSNSAHSVSGKGSNPSNTCKYSSLYRSTPSGFTDTGAEPEKRAGGVEEEASEVCTRERRA